jgi:beta-glucosidase
LLKNDNDTLPLAVDTPVIFIGGAAADDIGIQSGGWTIEWHGGVGAITPGTTILEGIQAAVSDSTDLHYNRFGHFEDEADENGNALIADIGIVVVGELPYAEWQGDNETLALSSADVSAIENMRAQSRKLVVILISGRPMIITDQLPLADAFVAAWLPGTEGAGVADGLFGNTPFTGWLPYTWPRSVDQLPFDFDNLITEGADAPLFPFGYGLIS